MAHRFDDQGDPWSSMKLAFEQCASAFQQLAAAVDALPRVEPVEKSAGQWPDLMPTSVAAKYCGFKTGAALRKARLEGRLSAVARRGGTGPWMWERAALDRFLRADRVVRPQSPEHAPRTPSNHHWARSPRKRSAVVEEALEKIRALGGASGRKRSR